MKTYTVVKSFGHDRGYTVAFRQHAASTTHCRYLHGYSLSFDFELAGETLDHRNWLFSFGDFKDIKYWLEQNFDHKTLVAKDDPALPTLSKLEIEGACYLNVLDKVGCEAIAKLTYDTWAETISKMSEGRARLKSVSVSEHNGNKVKYSDNQQG